MPNAITILNWINQINWIVFCGSKTFCKTLRRFWFNFWLSVAQKNKLDGFLKQQLYLLLSPAGGRDASERWSFWTWKGTRSCFHLLTISCWRLTFTTLTLGSHTQTMLQWWQMVIGHLTNSSYRWQAHACAPRIYSRDSS